jgi:hypothetical protein
VEVVKTASVFVGIIGALIVAQLSLSADRTLTAYWANAANHAAARETFAVEPQSRTVSALVRSTDGRTYFLDSMKDCTIVDVRNWQCGGTQAVDGLVTDPDHNTAEGLHAVNGLHWWAVRSWELLASDSYGRRVLPSFMTQDWASVTVAYAVFFVVLYQAIAYVGRLMRRLRAPKARAIPEDRSVRAGWRRTQRAI